MKQIVTLLLLACLSSITLAATNMSPYQVIESTGNRLFNTINNKQDELVHSPNLMISIVEQELMPALDYKYTAFKILGKHAKKSTKEQRIKFVKSMRSYLVKTYAAALKQYKNQTVIFEQDKPTGNSKIVAVSAKIIEANQPDIHLVFKMRLNKKTKQWKAFDLIFEGVSLLSSKQAELNNRINQFGLDKVTLELAVN